MQHPAVRRRPPTCPQEGPGLNVGSAEVQRPCSRQTCSHALVRLQRPLSAPSGGPTNIAYADFSNDSIPKTHLTRQFGGLGARRERRPSGRLRTKTLPQSTHSRGGGIPDTGNLWSNGKT